MNPVEITRSLPTEPTSILSADALRFLAKLEREFGARRRELPQKRRERQTQTATLTRIAADLQALVGHVPPAVPSPTRPFFKKAL